ncbi:BURP domain-containing protein 16-like [Coffea eugenioides]|uniref:BURP domain-containing protein 16-like n=1 Tax=Coffea eugenioides TaxID=49369 RepID=UPI000F615BF7|nr:BURP domain-containing protein 16-like [Coffea eugenioides]
MANLSFSMLVFVIASIYPAFSFCKTTSSSSIASEQLKYWYENVQNNMPGALLSKLSPLNKDDSEFFTSSASKQSFSSNAKFCSLANLACYAEMNSIKPLGNGYGYNNNKASPGLENVDPFSFFRISIFKQGNRVHLSNLEDQFPQRSFLPSQIASKISLDESNLEKVFPQSFVNPNTKGNIETTLLYCNSAALKGEIKSCSTSLESMIEFSKATLGSKGLVALTTKSTEGSGKELIIQKIKKLNVKKIVSCHEVFLPFSTYFCHMLSSTEIYAVDVVEPKTKAPVNTILAICHMDTSAWPSYHAAFKILKLSPGKGEACHWMTQIDLLWISAEENV